MGLGLINGRMAAVIRAQVQLQKAPPTGAATGPAVVDLDIGQGIFRPLPSALQTLSLAVHKWKKRRRGSSPVMLFHHPPGEKQSVKSSHSNDRMYSISTPTRPCGVTAQMTLYPEWNRLKSGPEGTVGHPWG